MAPEAEGAADMPTSKALAATRIASRRVVLIRRGRVYESDSVAAGLEVATELAAGRSAEGPQRRTTAAALIDIRREWQRGGVSCSE
jgi:hypothetical protein